VHSHGSQDYHLRTRELKSKDGEGSLTIIHHPSIRLRDGFPVGRNDILLQINLSDWKDTSSEIEQR
jgi:hypothetical protein